LTKVSVNHEAVDVFVTQWPYYYFWQWQKS